MTTFLLVISKFLDAIPGWVFAAIIAVQAVIMIGMNMSLASTKAELSHEIAEHSKTKVEQALADNRSLLNMSERYITLSNELASVRQKGAANATALQTARSELASVFSSMQRNASIATELERDFRAAGYQRASIYAAGVENIYRSCAKEYIDLGIGVGGAAEAANAAHAQKGRADAIIRALPPVRPIPPTK